jgi:pilus assembly protein CpaB
MGRRTLLLIASILLAALGTALIWLYVQGAETRALPSVALVRALFLTSDQGVGTSGDVVVAAATAKNVAADVANSSNLVTSAAQVAQLRLKNPAVRGQLLLLSMFTSGVPTGAQPGRGIVSITISDTHRVPAQIQAGQHVAVYALGRGAPRLVIRDITVVSVGGQSTTQTSPATVAPIIVAFDADPGQAVDLLAIETTGEQPALYLLGTNTQAKG